MSDLEKMLKDIVYGGVGAVASALETGSDLAKTFVNKGQKIVEQARPTAEDFARRMKATCDEAMKATGVDISRLTREQREQLAAMLAKLNKVEDAAAKAMKEFAAQVKDAGEEPVVEEPVDEEPEAEEPVAEEIEVEEAGEPEDTEEPVDDEEANG